MPASDLAFPGALGWGRHSVGGSGRHLAMPTSTVYRVKNLNADGLNTLKAAVDATGPRHVIFETSGTIVLNGDLKIRNPYISIWGETAPSPGITIRGGTLVVTTHNVIMRHLRVRPGALDGNTDGITVIPDNTVHNVIIDHCSVSWTTDEIMGIGSKIGASLDKVTISNCLCAEPLDVAGGHPFGILMGGSRGAKTDRLSLIRTITSHCLERNPRLGISATAAELINNVHYNWRDKQTCNIKNIHGSGEQNNFDLMVDMIGCYYKPGARSSSSSYAMLSGGGINSGSRIYVEGVICPQRPADTGDDWDAIDPDIPESPHRSLTRVMDSGDGHTPMSALAAYEYCLNMAGARPLDRDSVDTRHIAEVGNGSGTAAPSAPPGGWPNLPVVVRELTLPSNPNDIAASGFTNIEDWIHDFHDDLTGEDTGGTTPDPPPVLPDEGYSIKIQHFAKVFGAAADTDSVAITAVGGATKAAALMSSSCPWAQLDGETSSDLNNDDLGMLVKIDPSDLDAVQFERSSTGDNVDMRIWGSVLEYLGVSGGPNEFIVRHHGEITMGSGATSVHTAIGSISNIDRCIPIVSAVVTDATTAVARQALVTVKMSNDPSNGVLVERNASGSNWRGILTLLEFPGEKWTVQNNLQQEHTTTDGLPTEHIINPVPSWETTLIFPSFRPGANNSDELGLHIYPGPGTNRIYFEMDDDAAGTPRIGVAHLLTHPQLRVRRYGSIGGSLTPPGLESADNLKDVSITPVAALAQSLLIVTADNTSTAARYPRQYVLARFKSGTSLDTVELWRARDGASSNFHLQVAEFLMTDPGYGSILPVLRRLDRF